MSLDSSPQSIQSVRMALREFHQQDIEDAQVADRRRVWRERLREYTRGLGVDKRLPDVTPPPSPASRSASLRPG